MTIILFLLVVSLTIGAGGLGFFLWSLRSGQYDDLDGAANRILFDQDPGSSAAEPDVRRLSPTSINSTAAVPETKVHAGNAIPASHS
jgi:cbb3-type cytochrome oxidase maturation protein